MSHTGNIKGSPGTYIGHAPTRPSEGGPPGRADRPGQGAGGAPREEKTRIGRPPVEAEVPNSGGPREEKTRIGRMPTPPEPSRNAKPETKPETRSETKTGLFNFAQDGLEMGNAPRSSGRAREGKPAEVFEGPQDRERPRPTGERSRLERPTGERPRPTGERSTLERPTGERPRPTGERSRLERPTGERPRVGSRSENAGPGNRFDSPAPPRTGERPRLPAREPVQVPREPAQASRKADGPDQVIVAKPGGPDVSEDVKPLEDLLPEFSEPLGQELLAHHFDEELGFLGSQLRPSRLPPSERAARLWAFFLAYAEANAKDPAGHSAAGRERFQEVLTKHGFGALQDAATGKDGVQVALEMLEARSPEELQARLAGVQIEPGPEMLPSEVFHPVEQQAVPQQKARAEAPEHHTTLPEPPTTELPATPEHPESHFDAKPERTPQQQRKAAEPAVFDQKEPEPLAVTHPQTSPPPPGVLVPQPGMLPRVGQGVAPNPEDEVEPGRERRGTNKRLGPHMLWNALHGLRDSPEDSSLQQAEWGKAAFGAIIALAGAALLVAMLASL
jgi:hypothetical protein